MGQLGFGPRLPLLTVLAEPTPRPTRIEGLSGVTQLSLSNSNTCALLTDGTVRCWGVGVCKDEGESCYTPTRIPGLTAVKQISLGRRLCALHEGGTVSCTDLHGGGVERVPDLVDVAEVTSGLCQFCARVNDGTVRCWGNNNFGALGEGTKEPASNISVHTPFRPTPGKVIELSDVVQVKASGCTTCAVTKSGTVACWGENSRGLLGNGKWGGEQTKPIPVQGIDSAVEVDLNSHACARLRDGTMRCWGWNAWNMLGSPTKDDSATTPVKVVGMSGVLQIAVGSTSTCARTAEGTYCWGWNDYGQLGDGTTQERSSPVRVRW